MSDVGDLKVGWAQREMTPPLGTHMGGYWGRSSGAIDVHDPLAARAIVFSHGSNRACLLALDLVGLSAVTVEEIRTRIRTSAGIAAEAVMVCCTHTHAGPLTVPFRGMGELDSGYLERVVSKAADAVTAATEGLRVVSATYWRTPAELGVNRRQHRSGSVVIGHNPEGPVARFAHVLRLSAEGGECCTLFSHACHPVVLGNSNHSISADFAGAAVRHVERETGGFALFVNGACGDINPRATGGTFDDVEELGTELGEAVVRGRVSARKLQGGGIAFESVKVDLPLIDPPPRARIAAEKLALKLKVRVKKMAGGDYWSLLVPRAQLGWAEEMHELARSGATGLAQPFAIQGIRVGSLAFIGFEGEMFVRYQLDLERDSPHQPTVLCGYANGCIGYVPTADEYEHGGYEVGTPYDFKATAGTEAYKVYPSVQMIAPESDEIIRRAALSVLNRLKTGGVRARDEVGEGSRRRK